MNKDKERITITPKETIRAGKLLEEHCKPVNIGSDLFVYDEGWSDKEIALQVNPRLSENHIHRLRMSILGKLAPIAVVKRHTMDELAWKLLTDLADRHNALCDELNVPQHKVPNTH